MIVNEIFYSLQGEGFWAGTPCVFVRFSGCNLHCDFCDTPHQTGNEMDEAAIIAAIRECSKRCRHIVLTGGEPALQVTQELVFALKSAGYYLHIETNGTLPLPEGIDWVTLSPKYEDVVLEKASEVKLVYEGQDVSEWEDFSPLRYLQPCDRGDEHLNRKNLQQCIEFVKSNPKWSLSVQLHKLLDIR